jgi:predicted metal-dependent hydrolase
MSVIDFKQEVMEWAKEVRVVPKEIHVRKMNRKWASCSKKGRLTFSLALLKESKEVKAKAIVHELLHMKYPNHGRMFNTLLTIHLGNKGIEAKRKRSQ